MMTSVLRFKYLFTTIFIGIGFFLWLSYPRVHEFTGASFGTYYKVIVVSSKFSINSSKLSNRIQSRLEELDSLFSTYRSDSELMRLNNAPIEQNIQLNSEVVSLLKVSQKWHVLMGGVWDPTIVPVSQSFGFTSSITPNNYQIGFQHLKVIDNNTVNKNKNISIDLSSIAKGYAVDQLFKLISQYKVKGSYIDIGGEIRTSGHRPDSRPWGIGIQSPVNGRDLFQVIYVNDISIATSGNYINFKNHNQQKVGHILNPVSKTLINHNLLSVSVIADECAIADALATGLFVMGVAQAEAWLSKNYFPVMLVFEENNQLKTKYFNNFDHYLQN
ncbi:MAG: FAD:protein FMN transferase [Candidatus Margulisiibacteriota bacterium]